MNRRILILLIGCVLGLTACSAGKKVSNPMSTLTPPPSVVDKPVQQPDSLYNPGTADFLFSDNRARRVGDIVLVNIVETSEGKHTASTQTDKESSLELGVEAFFDKSEMNMIPIGTVFGGGPSMGPQGSVGTSPMVKASSTSEFEGDGETTRESEVKATVAARVVQVLPNGLLQVEGGREVRVNEETQIVVVRGLIRARDIGPDNSITSNYLADATIAYYGQGVLADKQRPGWLTRILDNIWPF